MTKVWARKNSEMLLKNLRKSTKILRVSASLALIFFLFSCVSKAPEGSSDNEHEFSDLEGRAPPTFMKPFSYDGESTFIIELKPKSLGFDCTLRNDSPYYWCGISGIVQYPEADYPQKIGTVLQGVVDSTGKKAFVEFVGRLKGASESAFLFVPSSYHFSRLPNGEIEIGALLYGAFNEDECMEVRNDFSSCPLSKKKLDIFSGQYFEHCGEGCSDASTER